MEHHELIVLVGGLVMGFGALASAGYYFSRQLFKPEDQVQSETEVPTLPAAEALVAVPPPPTPASTF